MNIGEFLERFGRTVFEGPLGGARTGRRAASDEPPELAEIRLAVLDRVREKSYRSGGRKIFPYDLVRVRLRGMEEGSSEVFAGSFFRRYLEQEARNALREAGCRYPENLRVEVDVTTRLPLAKEEWLVVEVETCDPAGKRGPIARLEICEGQANCRTLRLDKPRINIGRVVDVYRDQGLYRRNDLAFVDDTEINRSVSREHAHIQRDAVTGEYRLFNDRWYRRGRDVECGTWIVRDGSSHEVHRTSRGVKLEPGDEIHFGKAVAMFEVE